LVYLDGGVEICPLFLTINPVFLMKKEKSIILILEMKKGRITWSKSYKYVGAAQNFAAVLKNEFGKSVRVKVYVDGQTYNKSREKYFLTRLGDAPEEIPYIPEDFNC
jgi:hypothetical protein